MFSQGEIIFLAVLGGLSLLHWLYYLVVSGQISYYREPEMKGKINYPPVSVVISARNEAENLIEYLPAILNQDYPEFEVVVVNDRSVDETQEILKALELRHENLRLSLVKHTELYWGGKKFALTMGIKAAKYEHLVLTDADCVPVSNQWLKAMSRGFLRQRRVILGYGAYSKGTGLLNKLIRSETFLIAQQYLGLARLGLPYMGVGRNIAYRSELFFDNKGFASHQEVISGDDDLFINEVATRKNASIAFGKDHYTLSVPEKRFSDYLHQKRRHLTTSIRYSAGSQAALLLISLLHYSFYAAVGLSFMILPFIWPGLIAITVNTGVIILVSYPALRKTDSMDLLFWTPLTEWFTLLFYPFAFIWNTLISGSPWKNF
ncbi:glycosyltransferase [bacterium SCSIO 12741]|nr:glycosyltransferase [bacterium SCSIO 12741]